MSDSGYVSEEARKRFGRDMGIASIVAFGLAVLLPVLLMALLVPGIFMPFHGVDFPRLDDGAWWRGRLYYPANAGPRTRILSLGLDGGEPRAEAQESAYLRLLAGDEALWAFSGARLGQLRDGSVRWLTPASEQKVSPPFLVDGAPAVLAEGADGPRLRTWRDGAWKEQGPLPIPTGTERFHVGCSSALWLDGRLLVVLGHDDGYWLEVGEGARWQRLPGSAGDGTLLEWEGAPGLASFEGGDLVVRTLQDSLWGQRVRVPVRQAGVEVHAWPSGPDSLVLATWSPFSPLALQILKGGTLGAASEGAGPTMLSDMVRAGVAANVAALLVPLALAFFASSRMARARVGVLCVENREVAYASLSRRALAHLVDGAIGGAPALVAYGFLFSAFQQLPDFEPLIKPLVGVVAALSWSFLTLVAYSWTEGSSGLTPGKWLLGLRVLGTDLQPCGFGRALLRNLLRMVDGMWCYLPAIVLVAFSPQWQRLGDLVGRTVVVRKP